MLARLMETEIWCSSVPLGCMGRGLNKGLMAPACTSAYSCLLCGRRAQQRNNGICQLFFPRELPLQHSPWSQSIQFLSICSWHFSSCFPLLKLRASVCEWVNLDLGPLRGSLHLTQMKCVTADFQSDVVETTFFSTYVLGWHAWRGLGMGTPNQDNPW